MWQPNRAQWRLILIAAALLIVGWPPKEGGSLGLKAVHWLADPRNALPSLPPELPMSLGDNADAVAVHDSEEAEYYRVYDSSATARLRLRLRDLEDPFDPSTARQILAGVGILAALGVWRLGNTRRA
jgi:hypothetical protein